MKFDNTLSELYKDFRHIRRDDVYAQIRFYERHADELIQLNNEEHFTVSCYYANALFAAEEFERYLELAPNILERSIIEDIQFVDGIDVYLHNLENMAVAFLKLKNHEKAIKIAVQLYAVSGRQKKYGLLLKKILKSRRPKMILNLFAFAVLMAILWTAAEIGRMIILEPFFTEISGITGLMQIVLLNASLVSVFAAAVGHYLYVGRRYRKLIRK